MAKNVYQVTTREVFDRTTGEIGYAETVKRQKITIESESFYMVFIDYMAPLFSLKNGTSKAVLSKLCEMAEFNTGKVNLSTGAREKICKSLEISNNVLSKSLKELSEKKLIAGSKGTYTINAQIFWKGDLRSRSAYINSKEFTISFTVPLEQQDFEVKGEE